MKTTFKKVLCTIMALCLLLSSAVCLMGISTSAEAPADDTVVYIFTTTGTNATSYFQKNNTTTNISAAAAEGNTLRYTFDYYAPSTNSGYFSARNNSGTFSNANFVGVVNESTTGANTLAKGTVGHVDVTLSTREGKTATALYPGVGGAVGTIYMWNPRVWVNGTEVPVTGFGGATKTTYGAIPFETGAHDATAPTTPAFIASGWKSGVGNTMSGTFGGGLNDSGNTALISSTYFNKDSFIKVSFDFYNEDNGDVYAMRNHGVGPSAAMIKVVENTNPGSAAHYLGHGRGHIEFKSGYVSATAAIRAAIGTMKAATADKKLYFWNVKFEIYVDGVNNVSSGYVTGWANATTTTYGAIKDIVNPDPETLIPVYTFTTTGTTTTNYLQRNGSNIANADSAQNNSIRYSFDYYVPSTTSGNFTAKTNMGYFMNANVEGVVNDSTTGSAYLANGKVGHIDVTMKTREGISAKLYAGIGGAVGTIYIWNPKAWVNGTEVAVTGVGSSTTTNYKAMKETESFKADSPFDEVAAVSPAFKWTSAAAPKGTFPTATLGSSSLHYGGSQRIAKDKATTDSYIKMSFDYYNEAADDVFYVGNAIAGYNTSAVKDVINTNPGQASANALYLGSGYGSMEFKSKYIGSNADIYAGIGTRIAAETGKTLYVWNVRYEIYVDGEENNSWVYPTAMSEFTSIKYGDLAPVFEQSMKDFPVAQWAPASTTDTLTFKDAQRKDIAIAAKKGDTITISYDYYTTDSRYYRTSFNGTNVTGMHLPSGRNQFEQTITVTADGTVTPTVEVVTTKAVTKNKVLRLWNVKVTHNDKVVNVYPYIATGSGKLDRITYEATTEYDESKTDYMIMLDMRGMADDTLAELKGTKGFGLIYPLAFTSTESDTITMSFDYFVSGEAAYTRNAYGVDGAGAYLYFGQKENPAVGTGTMTNSKTAAFTVGSGLGAVPMVLMNSTKYPNFFYTWNVALESANYGKLTYIQQFGNVNGWCEGKTFTPYSEEMEYDEAEFTTDAKYVVKGDVNSDENGVADICDLVYLNKNSIFKDYRTFNFDKTDFGFVRDGIFAYEAAHK